MSTLDTGSLVRVTFPIGRHNPTEGGLDFCKISSTGGPGEVIRSETFNVRAERSFASLQQKELPRFGTIGLRAFAQPRNPRASRGGSRVGCMAYAGRASGASPAGAAGHADLRMRQGPQHCRVCCTGPTSKPPQIVQVIRSADGVSGFCGFSPGRSPCAPLPV